MNLYKNILPGSVSSVILFTTSRHVWTNFLLKRRNSSLFAEINKPKFLYVHDISSKSNVTFLALFVCSFPIFVTIFLLLLQLPKVLVESINPVVRSEFPLEQQKSRRLLGSVDVSRGEVALRAAVGDRCTN